jgi:hypothetical protein
VPSRADQLAKNALDRGAIRVDPGSGAIYEPNGQRAEILDRAKGYGRVIVWRRPYTMAMAHRVVWIAVHGVIPAGLHINHVNRRRWDNRISNLEVVAPAGNARHWQGLAYDAVSAGGNLDPGWLAHLASEARVEAVSPYTHSPEQILDAM